MLLSLLIASIPVAPFTSPNNIYIHGFPRYTLSDQNFVRADWLESSDSYIPSYTKTDLYVGSIRRRGNIVSFYLIQRILEKPRPNYNVDTILSKSWMSKGTFIPNYIFSLERYDCANDATSWERFVMTTDAIGDDPESKGGFKHPTDSSETNWVVTANQKRVTIEGYPYWAVALPTNDPRSKNVKNKGEWLAPRPGSIGAANIDYVCDNY